MGRTFSESATHRATNVRLVAGKLPGTAAEVYYVVAARGLTRSDVTRALGTLLAADHATATDGRTPRYTLTDAGRTWLAEPVARVSVPEVPEDATPSTGLVCGRRGITLTVAQCAAGWAARDGQDACSRGAEGPCRAGCPAGAKSLAVVEAAQERFNAVRNARWEDVHAAGAVGEIDLTHGDPPYGVNERTGVVHS